MWNITSNLLQAEATCRLLPIEHIAVLILLHDLQLTHLRLLLPLHFLPLLRNHGYALSLAGLHFLVHPVLIELVVKHVLVRVLQLVLVYALLFDLLSGGGAASFLTLTVVLL